MSTLVSKPRRRVLALLAAAVMLAASGCGEKKDAKAPSADSGMEDALALLPGNAIAVGTVDARGVLGSPSFGVELAKLVDKFMPLGQEAGFVATRDVDRVTWASYSYQGFDVAAVVVGRFDEAKIKQAALARTPTKAGGYLVASQYAGRDVYTLNNVGFTLLSNGRAIAGTEAGIRRVLERIKDSRVKRDLPPWMNETVETQGAVVAVAGDLGGHPVPPEALRQLPLPFVPSMKAVRALVALEPRGMQLASSMTFADEPAAVNASGALSQLAGKARLLALMGFKIESIDVKHEKQDVQLKVVVSDQTLRNVLANAPQWLGL